MIISHSRRFIFVKTRKTASTSVERCLHASLTPQDVWTPLSNPRTRGNRYCWGSRLDGLVARTKLLRWAVGPDSPRLRRQYRDHTGIGELLPRLGEERAYFSFCLDRNPWDYVVSQFFHRKARGEATDFDEFVHAPPPFEPNWYLYTIDDRIAVDAVYRYEDLAMRMRELSDRLRLVRCDLPRDKASYRPPGGYRQYYSPSTRDEVALRWAKTIDYLGYDF